MPHLLHNPYKPCSSRNYKDRPKCKPNQWHLNFKFHKLCHNNHNHRHSHNLNKHGKKQRKNNQSVRTIARLALIC